MTKHDYVHGYTAREAERLADQAAILEPLLHDGVFFPSGGTVFEPGCGTGRQTAALLARHPEIRIAAMDIDERQLAEARAALGGDPRVRFQRGDLVSAAPEPASMDHAFVCFLLEHLADPAAALIAVRRAVKPGGRVVVVEGDHGSCRFHPETAAARRVWETLPASQRALGGDPDIGRRLYGLLSRAGFHGVTVEPRLVYADAGRPDLRAGFVRRIIVPMVEGAKTHALATGAIGGEEWDSGIAGLRATDEGVDGVFCYTFFRATATA
jgi:SAM-dependent methyltransferase